MAVLFSLLVQAASYSPAILVNNYTHVYDSRDYVGQTYLSFVQEVIKPAIDEIATGGYAVADENVVEQVYQNVDRKVQSVVERNGGIEKVKKIARALNGKVVTLETLPVEIAKVDRSVNRYDLATFLALASGGGVVIQYYGKNYSYNVNYDTVEQKSGRSFGSSVARAPVDASDAAYLDDLGNYSLKNVNNLPKFYTTLMQSLLNTETSNYRQVEAFGQSVLTDFLSVYTAEQVRNLMDGRVDVHWDAALLEVTLLASFHVGQETFKLMYRDPKTQRVSFTDEVYNQTRCALPTKKRPASMRDYWQFSRRITDPNNCKRSGINITKAEFRKLESFISDYMNRNEPKIVRKLAKAMGRLSGVSKNHYADLSSILMDDETPKRLGKQGQEIAAAWVEFLGAVTNYAQVITEEIEETEL